MNASQLVSVVITTYNRSDALLAVLAGLARQTDHNFEVLVADDGSRTEHQTAIWDAPVARGLACDPCPGTLTLALRLHAFATAV